MANRAYLSCFVEGKRQPRELICSYTLAEGWLLLFTPDDLFTDQPAPFPSVEKTTSYLLAPAEVAITRWAQRVSAQEYALDDESMLARIYQVFLADFSQGHLYVDLKELEWMSDGVVEGIQRQLEFIMNTGGSVYEPNEENILLEYGWGTGLSSNERARKR